MLSHIHSPNSMLINGRAIATHINTDTTAYVASLKQRGITPKLAVLLIGNDKPSRKYVDMKGRVAQKLGIDFALHTLPGDTSESDIINTLQTIQHDPTVTGCIVQLPLPPTLQTPNIVEHIRADIDVDCLTQASLGKLVMNTNSLVPPTPGAVMEILNRMHIDLKGKNVTIIGTGVLVGKPLAIMMANAGASVTTVNIFTKNIPDKCRHADIIVSGVGKPHIITADMVRPDAIVIDTGIWFDDAGTMQGDVDYRAIHEKGAAVTPTPGGVGPITVSLLLRNTALCAERLAHV